MATKAKTNKTLPAVQRKASPKVKTTGFVLYEGPSVLDDQPIVVIATLKTSNRKTGQMVQTWVMRADMSPIEAKNTKADASVCGACPHRQALGGACYVNLGQAPRSIWTAYKNGAYSRDWSADTFADKKVRLGAYGDPAAAPHAMWAEVVKLAAAHTGYTHQMAHRRFDFKMLDFCMLSADTPKQAAAAYAQGLRTFRVKATDAPLLENEIECLADSKGLTCAQCMLCDGAKQQGASVVINVHGSLKTRFDAKLGEVSRRVIPLTVAA